MQKRPISSCEGLAVHWIGYLPPSGTQINLCLHSKSEGSGADVIPLSNSRGARSLSLEIICGQQSMASKPRLINLENFPDGSGHQTDEIDIIVATANRLELRINEDGDVRAELRFANDYVERFFIQEGARIFGPVDPLLNERISLRQRSAAGGLYCSGVEPCPDVDMEFAPELSAGVCLVSTELVRYVDGRRSQFVRLKPMNMVSAAELNSDCGRLLPAAEFVTLMNSLTEVRTALSGNHVTITLVYQGGDSGTCEQRFQFDFGGFDDPWLWFQNPAAMVGGSLAYEKRRIPALRQQAAA